MIQQHRIVLGTLVALVVASYCFALHKPQGESRVENTSKSVHTTASGLRYEVLRSASADARSPKNGDTVIVHYTGWLDDNGKPGKKFDSSIDRGAPFKFILGKRMVIAGWDEGVALMKVGEKRRLILPAQLGYGSRGVPGAIPANATLIFDVELLNIA